MSLAFFQEFLRREQLDDLIKPFESGDNARTAAGAAEEIGCEVSQIVKSLLVKVGDEFMMFLVPGDKRLDLHSISKHFDDAKVRMANADEVKYVTGYSIGGVPPIGHKSVLRTFLVEGFDRSETVYAAAGHQSMTFGISYDDLVRITKAEEFNI